ncbi:MAG TPA: DEAD/DEAH box helicase, partial [Gemmatimonadaceae bacterium]
PASASCVRRVIARAWLADVAPAPHAPRGDAVLGDVTLLPHQVEAVARLRVALDEFGGALLADETGLGKSFVALALAREARRALVVAPAGLRAAWGEALRRAGLCIPFRSTESLGRRAPPAGDTRADLVIVDEAHHFRNPRTRRYRRLAALARGARVLLLSATPVHNRAAELHAQLALFLGAAAATLDEAALARCIVRRGEDVLRATSHVPRVRGPLWLPAATDEGLLARLLALPPPLPPSDGGDGGALVVHGLVRRWSSSVGALRGALRRRLARAEALTAALEAGHHPTLAELRRWVVADDAVQLDFPELLAAPDAAAPAARLLRTVRAHGAAVRALLAGLRDGDEPRAHQLRRVRARHAGERVVAFSEHADTVDALYRLLARDGGVCALTGSGARVAGGALSRAEALRRFAPLAHGAAPPPPAERITLLLSTDVLSEGIGLQDASVVVHLDLPWTPARLEQRVGRVARLGSPHAEVSVYAFAPLPGAEAVLGVERTLRAKQGDAARLVGAPAHALPAVTPDPPGATHSIPALGEALRETFRGWLGSARNGTVAAGHAGTLLTHEDSECVGPPIVAAVASPTIECAALLALMADGGRVVLLAGELADAAGSHHPAAAPSDAPVELWRVASRAGGTDVAVDDAHVHHALATIDAWRNAWAGREALGVVPRDGALLRRALLRRVAAAEREAPRHRRAALARLAAEARHALATRCGAGTERALGELLADGAPGEPWLAAVVACVDEGAPHPTGGTVAAPDLAADALPTDAPPPLRALLLVTPAAVPCTLP